MAEPKSVHIFGVTGSVGQSACDIIASEPSRFDVRTVTAFRNVKALAERAIKLNARTAVIGDSGSQKALQEALKGADIQIAAGPDALIEAAREPADLAVMAIVGFAGLEPLWQALKYSKAVVLANKEPLVAAGPLVMAEAERTGCRILPIDSEHNAIFQLWESANKDSIERIVLTASGGPFRTASMQEIRSATPEDALNHPTWDMGAKISIDSATMMNKGFEVIEAHYLFDLLPDKIDILVHPQSYVHGMVAYEDGSVLTHIGPNDMRTPIAHALAWPQRMQTPGEKLDLEKMGSLEFEPVDRKKFPAIDLAYESLGCELGARIALNAVNEIMVERFLNKECGFLDITAQAAIFVEDYKKEAPDSLEDVILLDRNIRKSVHQRIAA